MVPLANINIWNVCFWSWVSCTNTIDWSKSIWQWVSLGSSAPTSHELTYHIMWALHTLSILKCVLFSRIIFTSLPVSLEGFCTVFYLWSYFLYAFVDHNLPRCLISLINSNWGLCRKEVVFLWHSFLYWIHEQPLWEPKKSYCSSYERVAHIYNCVTILGDVNLIFWVLFC